MIIVLNVLLNLFLMLVASTMHCIDQIAVNRRELSYLPNWIVTSEDWLEINTEGVKKDQYILRFIIFIKADSILDGFHIFKKLGHYFWRFTGVHTGVIIAYLHHIQYWGDNTLSIIIYYFISYLVVSWVIDGAWFTYLFHWGLMKKEHKGR